MAVGFPDEEIGFTASIFSRFPNGDTPKRIDAASARPIFIDSATVGPHKRALEIFFFGHPERDNGQPAPGADVGYRVFF